MSREIMKLISEKFTSGNSVEVERITITRAEYQEALAKPEPTQEQIYEIIIRWDSSGKRSRRELARRIETLFTEPRVHSTDGTPCWCDPITELAKPEQEPVARFNWNEAKFEWLTEYSFDKHHMKPLYLAPPKRKWVGLTDVECIKLIDEIQIFSGDYELLIAHAIELLLRNKNHG